MVNSCSATRLKRRHRQEKLFQFCGLMSVVFAIAFLVLLFGFIASKGHKAFLRSEIAVVVDLSKIGLSEEINYRKLVKDSLRQNFSEINESDLYQLLSKAATVEVKKRVDRVRNSMVAVAMRGNQVTENKPTILWLSAAAKYDAAFKNHDHSVLNESQQKILQQLIEKNKIKTAFNWEFFTFADSREAEIAGIAAGFTGSFLMVLVFMLLAFPIGVACAFYLEEFAPKNHLTDIVEVSINNLAAIPSIIYGLLGLVIYIQMWHFPRSSALVGGLTLFMLVLPVVVIATRNAIRLIPSSIRDAAAGLGATKMQIAFHHILPLSVPGIMTGTILAVSRALGETAPLLMIGMIAFVADVPQDLMDATTALPVQIYLWSDSPENAFAQKTAAAIVVLLVVLVALNSVAVLIRRKFERVWG